MEFGNTLQLTVRELESLEIISGYLYGFVTKEYFEISENNLNAGSDLNDLMQPLMREVFASKLIKFRSEVDVLVGAQIEADPNQGNSEPREAIRANHDDISILLLITRLQKPVIAAAASWFVEDYGKAVPGIEGPGDREEIARDLQQTVTEIRRQLTGRGEKLRLV